MPEVRFAQQFGMGYLQSSVMKHQDLLQKHTALLGIPVISIGYIFFNGRDIMNDALLSGAVGIASGAVPGLPTIWAKTKGTLLKDPRYKYILAPHAMPKWSDFMFKMGRIKAKPETWKDLFWQEIHRMDGS